jgi:hypothetical protein
MRTFSFFCGAMKIRVLSTVSGILLLVCDVACFHSRDALSFLWIRYLYASMEIVFLWPS